MNGRIIKLLLATSILVGCVTDQGANEGPDKQTIGTILGGIAGAVLGSQFGSGQGRLVGVAAGALAGAWFGSQIGASLDRADRLAIEQQSARALASAQDGQTAAWRNPDSGVSAKITPVNSRIEMREMTVVRDKRITPPPALVGIGETYEAIKNVNLRAAPSTGEAIVGNLQAKEQFDALGLVRGSDWILASRNGRSIGYVYAPLVQPAPSVKAPELRKAVNLDEISIDQSVAAERVTVETRCRTLKSEISTKDGQIGAQNFEACKGVDGAWEIL